MALSSPSISSSGVEADGRLSKILLARSGLTELRRRPRSSMGENPLARVLGTRSGRGQEQCFELFPVLGRTIKGG